MLPRPTRDRGLSLSLEYLASALVLAGCAAEPGGAPFDRPPQPPSNLGSAGAPPAVKGAGTSESSPQEEPEPLAPNPSPTTPRDAATDFEHCATGEPTLLASGQSGGGTALAVDDTRVYYGTRRGVMMVPIEGGIPELLAGAGMPIQIAVDATSVYFSDYGILRVDKTSGEVEVLVDMVTAGLAILGSDVYFSTWARKRTGIQRWSNGVLQSLTEFNAEEWVPRLLVADADLYYAPLSTLGSGLPATRYQVGAGEFLPVTTVDLARSFDVADGYFYFTDESSLTVKKVAVAGGTPSELGAFGGYPVAIAADMEHVYFTLHDLDPNTLEYSGRVVRISVDGSGPCQLGSFDSYTAAITIDDRYVYWQTSGSAESASSVVMRALK